MVASLLRMHHLGAHVSYNYVSPHDSLPSFNPLAVTRFRGRSSQRHISSFSFRSPSSRIRPMPLLALSSNNDKSATSDEPLESVSGGIEHVSSQISALTSFSVVWDVLGLIFKLPGMIMGFLQKEEAVLNEIEEEVDEAADIVKLGAKMVGKFAKEAEKLAEVVEKDADEVAEYMDEVKVTTKTVHKEIDEVIENLEAPIEEISKVKVKVNVKEDLKEAASSSTTTTTTTTITATNSAEVHAASSSSSSETIRPTTIPALTSSYSLSNSHHWDRWISFLIPDFLNLGNHWIMAKAFMVVFGALTALHLHGGPINFHHLQGFLHFL